MNTLQSIVVRHRETGQVMTTTNKAFDAVYQAKGFEVVDRDNAGPGTAAGRIEIKMRRDEPVSTTGSAAAVAVALGLESATTPDPASSSGTTDSALPIAETNKTNEIIADIDSELSDERAAKKQNRGGRTK